MLRSVLFTALLALSFAASADEFDYNYLNVGYQRMTLDDGSFDVDGDGFGIGGSFEITESFFLSASYGMAEFEEQGVTVDFDTWSAGLGWHTPLSDTIDFVSTLSYERVEASALGFSADDDGFGLGVGLRFAASEAVEINGGIDYVDFGDGGDDTTFGLGMLYGLTDNIDLGLNGEWGDDVSSYGISGRFYFGN